ncbi:MAG: hypothetical protein Q9210_003781 [Variospora velana]
MHARSIVFLVLLAASAQLVAALPPSCLIKAINTEPEPANLSVMCGSRASNVQAEIRKMCSGNTDVAMKAYKQVCEDAGKTVCG